MKFYVIILFLLMPVCSFVSSVIPGTIKIHFEFSEDDYQIREINSGFQILDNRQKKTEQVDSSVIPYHDAFIVIPHGANIDSVKIMIEKSVLLMKVESNLVEHEYTKNEYNNRVKKKYHISGSILTDQPFINYIVELFPPELRAGYSLVKLRITPFLITDNRCINLLTQLDLHINYSITGHDFIYEKTPKHIEISREYIKKQVLNPGDIDRILPLEQKLDYSKIRHFDTTHIQDQQKERENKRDEIPQHKTFKIRKIK